MSKELSWYGQNVVEYKCLLSELAESLPEFSRHRFGVNEYLDSIIREPFCEDRREIPVASVSKKYMLIQHTQVARWLADGLVDAGIQPQGLPVLVKASDYRERVLFSVRLPNFLFDPGDGFDVEPTIEVLNSVDKTTSFIVRIAWLRLVCSNGMLDEEERALRIIHNRDWMKKTNVENFIREQVNDIPSVAKRFREWLDMPISIEILRAWVDDELPRKWGVNAAARCYSILLTGYDGDVNPDTRHLPPSKREVSRVHEVPGACAPVNNAYHALQALVWVSAQKESIEISQKMRCEVPVLFESLLQSIR